MKHSRAEIDVCEGSYILWSSQKTTRERMFKCVHTFFVSLSKVWTKNLCFFFHLMIKSLKLIKIKILKFEFSKKMLEKIITLINILFRKRFFYKILWNKSIYFKIPAFCRTIKDFLIVIGINDIKFMGSGKILINYDIFSIIFVYYFQVF